MREIEVKILRGAETDNRRYQTYTVAVEEDAAVSVMNLLEEIYNKQDHSLAFFSHAAVSYTHLKQEAGIISGRTVP